MKETFVAETIWERIQGIKSGNGLGESGMVLALVIRTEASTYQKAGAMAVLDGTRVVAGMVSGGCLEADLAHRVAQFLHHEAQRSHPDERPAACSSQQWSYVRYDTRKHGDDVLGTALGCRGALDIALLRMDDPGVAAFFRSAWSARSGKAGFCSVDSDMRLSLTTVDQSSRLAASVLRFELSKGVDVSLECMEDLKTSFVNKQLTIPKRRRALLCGCGLDAIPIVRLFMDLGFELTVVDHRPDALGNVHSAASRMRADDGVSSHTSFVTAVAAQRLATGMHPVSGFDAVLVMSHHLEWDGRYLDAVKMLDPNSCYIGLLGPPARRKEVFALLNQVEHKHPLDVPQLHSPMGLRFATRGSTAVAVGVFAELLQFFAGQDAKDCDHST